MKPHFLYGFLTCMSLTSLWQDYMGQEEYIRYIQNHWVSGGLTVPLAFLILTCVIINLRQK